MGSAQVSRRYQDHQGQQEKFLVAPLSTKQRSAKGQDQYVSKASSTSQPLLSQSTESYLHSLQTSHVFQGLPQNVCLSKTPSESVSADITLPTGLSPPSEWQKLPEHHQKCFGAFFSMESQQMKLNYKMQSRPILVCH